MHVFDEMKAYVGFDDESAALLRAFWPTVRPHVKQVVGHFYERILAFPSAEEVLASPAQIHRLKRTLEVWLRELLVGPHDEAYFVRRERIGKRHVEVGLPPRFMFTAMSVMRDDLCQLAFGCEHSDPRLLCRAIGQVTSLDLAIMTGTFIERREERQLSTLQDLLVSHIPVTVILADREGEVVAATGAHRRLFAEHEVLGRHFLKALPAEVVEEARLEQTVERAIASGREISIMRVDVRIASRSRSFRLDIVPLDHPRARVLLHIEELTDAVETEARMQRSEALAQLGSLSAAVAHELRNPLAGMSGAIQVIARSLEEDDRRGPIMGKVQEQIQRLDGLVSELLAFARPGTAQMRQVDLRKAAEGVVDLVRAEGQPTRLEVQGQGHGRGDANMVHQILLNLVHNAIQAMEPGGRVRVRIEGPSVWVSDDGPGVPEELRADIFKPFFTTRTRGTGLGLAVCQRAALAMEARLELCEPGGDHGAQFRLTLKKDEGLAELS